MFKSDKCLKMDLDLFYCLHKLTLRSNYKQLTLTIDANYHKELTLIFSNRDYKKSKCKADCQTINI